MEILDFRFESLCPPVLRSTGPLGLRSRAFDAHPSHLLPFPSAYRRILRPSASYPRHRGFTSFAAASGGVLNWCVRWMSDCDPTLRTSSVRPSAQQAGSRLSQHLLS